VRLDVLRRVRELPEPERSLAQAVIVFTVLVCVVFLASLVMIAHQKLLNPGACLGGWLAALFACIGYIVGLLVGLLAVPCKLPPAPPEMKTGTAPWMLPKVGPPIRWPKREASPAKGEEGKEPPAGSGD